MDIKQLSQRALEIRQKYAALEKKKHGKEWTNLNLMEGFVGDVGELMKVLQAKEGLREMEQVDEKLSHELADCLWSILVLSEKYGVDIEQNFLKNMDDLEKRIAEQEIR